MFPLLILTSAGLDGPLPPPCDFELRQATREYAHRVSPIGSRREERVRAAEVVAALSLATDLALGMQFEHGIRSTLFAMRLSERLGVDAETAGQVYYICLLFYVGCTTDAEIAAEIFPDDSVVNTYINPVLFGSPAESMLGMVRALAPPEEPATHRVVHLARRLPRVARHRRQHLRAICEVAQMLADRLGLPLRCILCSPISRSAGMARGRGRSGATRSLWRFGSRTSLGMPRSISIVAAWIWPRGSCGLEPVGRSIPTSPYSWRIRRRRSLPSRTARPRGTRRWLASPGRC